MINSDIEYKSVEEIKAFQEELLHRALAYLKDNSPYYQRMFKSYGINIEKIRHIEDLVKIPFTEKKDLQLFNDEFLCCPKAKIIDYITTSGTLGDPVTFGCTEKDLQRLAFNEKKSFECAGVKPGNIVQLMTTLDKRFMAGLAYFLGLRELGASVIRVGNGIPELQWDTIRRIKPDTIMCVPSFILNSYNTPKSITSTIKAAASAVSSALAKACVTRTSSSTSLAGKSRRNGTCSFLPPIRRLRWVPPSRNASTGWAVTCILS